MINVCCLKKDVPKATWLGSHDPFLRATVDTEKFCYSMLLSHINNAVDSGPLLLAPTMVSDDH